MKIAVVLAGAFVALAVSGPTLLNTGSAIDRDQVSEVAVPGWLNLPSTPFINSIEYSGEAGREASSGMIFYNLPSDGASEMVWLMEHLKAEGYSIEDRTTTIDNFAGAKAVISASDLVTGRQVIFVRQQTIEGANLRIMFEDPLAGTRLSQL
ncbi:MAG: hypothetical protein GYA66_09405 [Phyllobacteriaceae bacterium]|jgi:hypothetical protein|nr:hypothetical protein [Phyllobacteriaceae bacterium]